MAVRQILLRRPRSGPTTGTVCRLPTLPSSPRMPPRRSRDVIRASIVIATDVRRSRSKSTWERSAEDPDGERRTSVSLPDPHEADPRSHLELGRVHVGGAPRSGRARRSVEDDVAGRVDRRESRGARPRSEASRDVGRSQARSAGAKVGVACHEVSAVARGGRRRRVRGRRAVVPHTCVVGLRQSPVRRRSAFDAESVTRHGGTTRRCGDEGSRSDVTSEASTHDSTLRGRLSSSQGPARTALCLCPSDTRLRNRPGRP